MRRYALWLLVLVVLVIGSQFRFFNDEADNLLGGKVIASGGALYTDYWSHHMPVMYELGAGMWAVGVRTVAVSRLVYALLIWCGGVVLAGFLRIRAPLFMLLALAFVAPSTGMNMMIAESLNGLLALAGFLLVLSDRPALPLTVLLVWLIPMTGLKQVYLAALLTIVTVLHDRRPASLLRAGIAPALLMLAYCAVYGNGAALIDQAYHYNSDVYAPFFHQSAGLTAGLSSMLSGIAAAFAALARGQSVPLVLPVVFPLALLVVWLVRRRWLDALALAGLLVLSFPPYYAAYSTANHFTTHYIVITGTAAYAVWYFWQGKRGLTSKLALTALFVLALLPGMRWNYDRVDAPPQYAAKVNMLAQGEPVWLAPALFNDWLNVDAPNAGRYYFMYPWLWADAVIRADLLHTLETNPPRVVVYQAAAGIDGHPEWTLPHYAPELDAWIRGHYVEVEKDIWVRK